MGGRENDFAFIKELLDRTIIEMEIFMMRAEQIRDMPQSNALLPRLEKLEICLRDVRPRHDLISLQRLAEHLW